METGRSFTWWDGRWHEGDVQLMSSRTHAAWLASTVFDGARALEGRTPDLDRHCRRLVRSAEVLGLAAPMRAEAIVELAQDGLTRFAKDASLYIRPMLHAEAGDVIAPVPETTVFTLSIWESGLPQPGPRSACVTKLRRPGPELVPTLAKAACLYPQAWLAQKEAKARGFDDALMLDPVGNVAEFAYTNVFFAKDGEVYTPVWNGCFLSGITRQRVIQLLREAGVAVHERAIRAHEVEDADEVFCTGNYAKLLPLTRIEDRVFQPGPLYAKARELYWDWMHA